MMIKKTTCNMVHKTDAMLKRQCDFLDDYENQFEN